MVFFESHAGWEVRLDSSYPHRKYLAKISRWRNVRTAPLCLRMNGCELTNIIGVASFQLGFPCSSYRQSQEVQSWQSQVICSLCLWMIGLMSTVGETPFQSKVTGKCEHLPVAVSLLSSPGTCFSHYSRFSFWCWHNGGRDMELFNQARDCLKKAGRATSVGAGKKLFSS